MNTLLGGIFTNYPLLAAFTAIFVAQGVKVPWNLLLHRKLEFSLIFSTGGMPSSHSAAVTALATAIGISEGFSSSSFAISLTIGVIVMFDAMGVRRHAGTQAAVLNKLVEEFNHFVQGIKTGKVRPQKEQREKLKELLGHQPIEVLVGGILGVFIALVLDLFRVS